MTFNNARFGIIALLMLLASTVARADHHLPNILWITSEDNGPHMGCYGDEFADTPHLDKLAKESVIYLNCWSTAPVCAPARTTLISGLYPPSTGAEHMRSMVNLPAAFKMYPQYLREAGYYCTNNSKEDFNLEKPGQVWDESGGKAHWRKRKPGQPFFAIFNIGISHESKIRTRPHTAIHDAAKVRVPAYHPDVPEVRRDWAQYYDKMTEMDKIAGQRLKELEDAGLADDTIIFYYGDHGSGMPRSKRWPYNSGLQVPLIVHVPEKFKHLRADDYQVGGKTDRLVGFIDMAPTLLSIIGVKPKEHFHGHAFMGKHTAKPQEYLYGFRGRMDERYDMLRVVRDQRYVYIRNYMPHKIYGQYIQYMFQTPTTRIWKEMFDDGKLNKQQSRFWQRKPAEELYDLQSDPDEVNNLATSAKHQDVLKRLRTVQRNWALEIKDVGFLPEGEIHSRSDGSSPYEMGHDSQKYDMKRIMDAAELASSLEDQVEKELIKLLSDKDSAVRYWAAMGILMRGNETFKKTYYAVRKATEDDSPYVQILAAQCLAQFGEPADIKLGTTILMKHANVADNGIYRSMLALNALDELDGRAKRYRDEISKLPKVHESINRRMRAYVKNLITKTVDDIK